MKVFAMVVGRTMAKNNTVNGAGKPTIISAEYKNVVPLIMVPKKAIIPMETCLFLKLSNTFIIIYTAMQVTSLSMILGICPPGKVVVMAVRIPPRSAVTTVLWKSLLIKSATNMKASMRSNFMLPNNPGVT